MDSGGDAADLSRLLNELCVDLGFCLPPTDQERLRSTSWERPADLADAVFEAEGMAQPYNLRLWRDVRSRIEQHLNSGA